MELSLFMGSFLNMIHSSGDIIDGMTQITASKFLDHVETALHKKLWVKNIAGSPKFVRVFQESEAIVY